MMQQDKSIDKFFNQINTVDRFRLKAYAKKEEGVAESEKKNKAVKAYFSITRVEWSILCLLIFSALKRKAE